MQISMSLAWFSSVHHVGRGAGGAGARAGGQATVLYVREMAQGPIADAAGRPGRPAIHFGHELVMAGIMPVVEIEKTLVAEGLGHRHVEVVVIDRARHVEGACADPEGQQARGVGEVLIAGGHVACLGGFRAARWQLEIGAVKKDGGIRVHKIAVS